MSLPTCRHVYACALTLVLFGNRNITGEVMKKMDALSRSVTAHLEKLKYGVATPDRANDSSAGTTQGKIVTAAQNRKLRAELGRRISALEMRVVQCEQTLPGGGCCWISVRDTAIEAFENEVMHAARRPLA